MYVFLFLGFNLYENLWIILGELNLCFFIMEDRNISIILYVNNIILILDVGNIFNR